MVAAPVASIDPVGKRILVKIEKETSQVKNGIYIPETATERPTIGVIVSVGDAVQSARFAHGVSVLFPKYAGTDVEVGGEKLLILDVESVLALVNREPFEG